MKIDKTTRPSNPDSKSARRTIYALADLSSELYGSGETVPRLFLDGCFLIIEAALHQPQRQPTALTVVSEG